MTPYKPQPTQCSTWSVKENGYQHAQTHHLNSDATLHGHMAMYLINQALSLGLSLAVLPDRVFALLPKQGLAPAKVTISNKETGHDISQET